MTPMTMTSTSAALRMAAAAFRNGRIEWGTGDFRDESLITDWEPRCCAAGGIAYALDPEDRDGDPRWINSDLRPISAAAVDALADYLVAELGAAERGGYVDDSDMVWVRDPIEVVADWNDAEGRTLDEVVAALESAADRVDVRQAVTA